MTRPAREGEGSPARHVAFVVIGPPVPKARPRVVQHGRERAHGFTPGKTKAYEQLVATHALAARQRAGRWPLDARYRVEIEVRRRDGKGDLDNFVKSALDACNGVLWQDDGQVDVIEARRVPPNDIGDCMCVTVAAIARARTRATS